MEKLQLKKRICIPLQFFFDKGKFLDRDSIFDSDLKYRHDDSSY